MAQQERPYRPRRGGSWTTRLALCSLLSACGPEAYIYRTEPLTAAEAVPPPAGQARIVALSVHKLSLGQNLSQGFTCLDGRDLGAMKRFLVGTESELVVPPGRHYFTLVADYNGIGVPYLLWLDALPNHLYEVRAEGNTNPGHGEVSSRFADHATGKTVGGLIGGQPPVVNDPPKCTYKP